MSTRLETAGRMLAVLGTLIATMTAPGAAQFEAGRNFVGPTLSLSGTGSTVALGGQFERAVTARVGVGGAIGYWSYGEQFSALGASGNYDVSYVAVAGTGSYHFEVKNRKFDPFVGAALGYYIVNSSVETNGQSYAGSTGSRLFVGAFGALRYFVKENMAVVGRVGVGSTYLSLGMDFRF